MQAKERLFLNADKTRLVKDGDKHAAYLYAVPGDEIPESAAKKFGLVDGRLKGSDEAEAADALRKKAEEKAKAEAEDKKSKAEAEAKAKAEEEAKLNAEKEKKAAANKEAKTTAANKEAKGGENKGK